MTHHEDSQHGEAEAILEEHQIMLRGYLRHLVGSSHDADDLAQNVSVSVLERPEILMRGDDPAAYLRGIARHFASRHHRRIKRDPVLEAIMEVAWQEEAPAVSDAERNALSVCLAQLSEKLRRMIALRYEENVSSRRIGEQLRMSADAVRMALARARQALARCLKGRDSLPEGA